LATTKSTKFNVRGINHLALVVSDMEKTMHFYKEALGLPLVRTAELPDGGQQFFFQISDHSMISACWYPDAATPEPGIVNGGWGGYDPETGQQLRTGRSGASAHGSMHHVAFDIPLEKQEEYKERLRAAGVPVTEVNHHILYGKDQQVAYPNQVPDDAEAVDEFINSIYFPDPDGRTFEFAAWTRPLVPDDVKHTPARAQVVEEEVEVAARRTEEPRSRAAGA
jgi:catechol 2,3-dioxygenase-like lactoylglutathione lyase family enzyme